MKPTQSLDELWNKVSEVRSFDDLLQVLAADKILVGADAQKTLDRLRLRLTCHRTAKEFLYDQPQKAKFYILEHLVPACLEPGAPLNELLHFQSLFRKLLAEWLEAPVFHSRHALRKSILQLLGKTIQDEGSKEACWTVAAIGYREPTIEKILWTIAANDSELGDAALNTIVDIGVPRERRQELVKFVHERSQFRPFPKFYYVIQELRYPEFQKLLLNNHSPDRGESQFIYGLIAGIARENSSDAPLSAKLWKTLLDLVVSGPNPQPGDLLNNSDLLPAFDLNEVIPDALQFLPKILSKSNHLTRAVLYERLEHCTSPRQLLGWKTPFTDGVLKIIRKDAQFKSVPDSAQHVRSFNLGLNAFETLLCSERANVEVWLKAIPLAQQDNTVQRDILNLAACFRHRSLSPTVRNLITRTVNIERNQNASEYFSWAGAMTLAQSSPSIPVLKTVLNFGLTFDGQVLSTTVDTLREITLSLLKSGNLQALQIVLDSSLQNNSLKRRTAAIGVLPSLALHGFLTLSHTTTLIAIADDISLPPYLRTRAVQAISLLQLTSGDDALAAGLLGLRPNPESEEFNWRVLEAIINVSHWKISTKLLKQRLGLIKKGQSWKHRQASQLKGWQTYIISLLYTKHNGPFRSLVVDLLESGSASQVQPMLNNIVFEAAFDPAVATALKTYTLKRQTTISSEPYLFELLSSYAPELFLSTTWDDHWSVWIPDSRRGLADVFCGMTTLGTFLDHVSRLLSKLMTDSIFAVRRAAYKALSRINYPALLGVCVSWQESSSTEFRKRAAECITWISHNDHESWTHVQSLLEDPEASVRKIARQSKQDRIIRFHADQCSKRVLQVLRSNKEVLVGFKYGRALVKTGDDTHIQALSTHLNNPSLSTHVRHWLQLTIKALKERWQKVTQSWPEPWIDFEGSIEEVSGVITVPSGTNHPAKLTLWVANTSDPSVKPDWGGAVWTQSPESGVFEAVGKQITITIPNRIVAKASMNYASGIGLATFFGQGAYPTKISAG